MESEAVTTVLSHFDSGEWTWIGSEAIQVEINRMTNFERKMKVERLTSGMSQLVLLTAEHEKRARELVVLGFKLMDALQVACAESGRADVFLTTDDQLVRIGRRHKGVLAVQVANPLHWLEKVLEI
jgi:predicted nucleic acid-binding protein